MIVLLAFLLGVCVGIFADISLCVWARWTLGEDE